VAAPFPSSVFVAYRDAPERRGALRAAPGSIERYRLFGLDEITARGVAVRHNLESAGRPPLWARAADAATNRLLYGFGGYGGDFLSVLPSLRAANRSEVVLSTVDTVGIPLLLLRRIGLLRVPLVYVAIGLPERLVQLRGARMERLYASALRRAAAIVAYAESEAEWLRGWLGESAPTISFVPFGVDTDAFRPCERKSEFDVLSVGADPQRDYQLLVALARRRPEVSFRIVASNEHARLLGKVPANVTVETEITLETVRDRLAAARVVALPVRENSYSGATTTLLQAMAMAKPTVVSRTDAIATGYELEDGVNVRLVPPADVETFEQALSDLLAGADAATALGIRARETVERSLTWKRYTNALLELLSV
jgi:glycosyltransferase involved in cell wall biosynthesis